MSNIRTYRVNNAMQMISIPLHSTTNSYHFGNNREVVGACGAVTQVTNYYPFGAPYADASASKGADVQPYKYNGKELDLMHGLNTYDYGARQHDPVLARWDRIDPLCEKYYSTSPYAYCTNNPVNAIDPDGRVVNFLAGGIGAGVGAAIYAYIAYCEDKSAEEIWGAAAEGAIVGGVTGLTLGANTAITASSATKTTKTITKGKNWSVQMGIGTMVNKASECFDSAKKAMKSVFNKLF